MRRYVIAALASLVTAMVIASTMSAPAHARILTIDSTQSGTINIPTGSATQILNNDPNATRTYLVNYSTTNIFLSFMVTTSTSTPQTFSLSTSTGSFYLAGSTTPWSPDGPLDSFTGPMWAQTTGGGAPLTRIRFH